MRESYHVVAAVEGEQIRVRGQISRHADLFTTHLIFRPPQTDEQYPVTVYWKTAPPTDHTQQEQVNRAVLEYCSRLYHEEAYAGPINCCL